MTCVICGTEVAGKIRGRLFYLSAGDKFLDILAVKDEYKKLVAGKRDKYQQ